MRALIVCGESPLPANAGFRLRSWGWIRTISRFAEVGLVTLTRTEEDSEELEKASACCNYVKGVPAPRTLSRKLSDTFLSRLTRTPYFVRVAMSANMKEQVRKAIHNWKPDLVQAERIDAAPYLQIAQEQGIPTVYSAHNVESRILVGLKKRQSYSARRMQSFEMEVASAASAVVTVSETEEAWFQPYPKSICRIPNAVFVEDYEFVPPSSRAPGSITFIGHLRYPPNRDAARILAREVFPIIRRSIAKAECIIAGHRPGQAVLELEGQGIRVENSPIDLTEIWKGTSVFVCPLRWGAGSRIKLLEAAACGIPIVATGWSVEGLYLRSGEDFVQAETPEAMAKAVIELMKNPARADTLATNARRKVSSHHDWNIYQEKIARFYEDLADHDR